MRSILIFLLCLPLFTACSSTQNTLPSEAPKESEEIMVDPSVRLVEGASVYIKHAEIINDQLKLSISYSGGCEDHDFALNTRGDFSATYPPELKITLWHDANGDRCRAVIDKNLWYDLTPIQYPGTNQVLLILTNTDKTITYTY